MLGQRAVGDGMVGQCPRESAFADAVPRPVDHLRGEHGADAHLLTEADQERVHARRIDVGEFGEVADAHHHLGGRKPATHVEIPAEARREPKADRFEHRIEPHLHAVVIEPLDRGVKALECGGHIGHHHHLTAPVGSGGHVRGVDGEHEARAGPHGGRDLPWLKAVDRHLESLGHEHSHRVGDTGPLTAGIAAKVDAVGAGGTQSARLVKDRGQGQPRRVIDLGNDLDVEGAIVGKVARLLAEEFIEPSEVFGAALHRDRGDVVEGIERAVAAARDDDSRGARGHGESAGDPLGGHQRRDGDVQHLHRGFEADPRLEACEHLPERMLGEPAGDEMDFFLR